MAVARFREILAEPFAEIGLEFGLRCQVVVAGHSASNVPQSSILEFKLWPDCSLESLGA